MVCFTRRLQLNHDKTEAIWFGSRAALKKLQLDQRTFQIGSSTIQSSAAVRDLGVYLDAELSMKQHINKATACATIIFVIYDRFVDVLAVK